MKEVDKENIRSIRSNHDAVVRMRAGRPCLPSLLTTVVSHRKTIILGCGPESLKVDLSNAAAKLQSHIISN